MNKNVFSATLVALFLSLSVEAQVLKSVPQGVSYYGYTDSYIVKAPGNHDTTDTATLNHDRPLRIERRGNLLVITDRKGVEALTHQLNLNSAGPQKVSPRYMQLIKQNPKIAGGLSEVIDDVSLLDNAPRGNRVVGELVLDIKHDTTWGWGSIATASVYASTEITEVPCMMHRYKWIHEVYEFYNKVVYKHDYVKGDGNRQEVCIQVSVGRRAGLKAVQVPEFLKAYNELVGFILDFSLKIAAATFYREWTLYPTPLN